MTPDRIAIGVAAAALGAHALLTTVAAGDMTRPPRSSEVSDSTVRVWLQYAESFEDTSFSHHVGRTFCAGVALGIGRVKQLFSRSEITQLQAEIQRLEGVVAEKQRKLEELQQVLTTYNQFVAKYGVAVAERDAIVQDASDGIGEVAKVDQQLVTTLEECDALVQRMVADFESINNTALLGQYAQLAASCQQERDKIERLTRELDALQRKYPQIMAQFRASSEKLGHIKRESRSDLAALAGAANVISPIKGGSHGHGVQSATRVLTAEVST